MELDRHARHLADRAAEPRASVLAPSPGQRPERRDVLDAAATLDAVGEAEPHAPAALRFEPGVRTEPRRQRPGVDHEPPDVLRCGLDRFLVDLRRDHGRTSWSATTRLPFAQMLRYSRQP